MRSAPARIVLTPEHVEIRLEPAGLGRRFGAVVIDGLLILGILALSQKVFLLFFGAGIGKALQATASFLVIWGYHVFNEVRFQGRTPGKRMLGLRVVDGRGLPLTVQQSFVRNVVRVLDFLPLLYGLGGFVALWDRDHRRLGDLVADTLVVREDVPWSFVRLPFPPLDGELGGPAALRRLRHRLSLEEREFLVALSLRADRLDDRARFDLMAEVGGHYREKLGLQVPHLSDENLVRALASAAVKRE
ncbi:MAG: RDD family protein [Thermoanaerobaculia bacterium]|nr:RDD family protein [Thermoanaerobaculia bacterium]